MKRSPCWKINHWVLGLPWSAVKKRNPERGTLFGVGFRRENCEGKLTPCCKGVPNKRKIKENKTENYKGPLNPLCPWVSSKKQQLCYYYIIYIKKEPRQPPVAGLTPSSDGHACSTAPQVQSTSSGLRAPGSQTWRPDKGSRCYRAPYTNVWKCDTYVYTYITKPESMGGGGGVPHEYIYIIYLYIYVYIYV